MAVKTFGSPTTLKSVIKMLGKKEDWQDELMQFKTGTFTVSPTGSWQSFNVSGLNFTPEIALIYQMANVGDWHERQISVLQKDSEIFFGMLTNQARAGEQANGVDYAEYGIDAVFGENSISNIKLYNHTGQANKIMKYYIMGW